MYIYIHIYIYIYIYMCTYYAALEGFGATEAWNRRSHLKPPGPADAEEPQRDRWGDVLVPAVWPIIPKPLGGSKK